MEVALPKSTRSPAFQFYPNEWLGSTHIMLMNPAEEGAYIRLLAIAWNSEDCSLPDDDNQLAILSRLNEGWFNGSSTKVRACFFSRNKKLFNQRLLKERKKQEEWKEKCRVGGIKSGKSRRLKENINEGLLKGSSTKDELKANSSFSSSSSISIPKKERKEKKIFIKPTLQEVSAYCVERGRGVDPEKWMNHYESNGWMVGKNKMQDWKAAVRTWEGNVNLQVGNKQSLFEKNLEAGKRWLERTENDATTKA